VTRYTIAWHEEAVSELRRLRKEDRHAVKPLLAAIAALADDPCPEESNALGTTAFRRLRVGDYRALYEIADEVVAVYVLKVGRRPAR
jgi:mRNA interferase RelE/StbE